MNRIGWAAGLAYALLATTCLAETPDFSGSRGTPAPLLQRGRLFSGQTWWTRFGEPVNAAALAQDEAVKGEAVGSMPLYGHDYIFAPGSCDCPPPCIDHLWAGYYQHPHRCKPYQPLFRRHGCCGDGSCGRDGCDACSAKAACGCGETVSCSTPVADCSCKPVCGKCRHFHLGERWKGWTAHWHRSCDSCAAPLSCGCATPVAPAFPSEKQAGAAPPLPLPEDAALLSLPRIR